MKLKKKLIVEEGYISPADLHTVLPAANTEIITFNSEARMTGYRRMLYTINKQGTFRYRTMRDEDSMWGIVIYRLR